MQKRFSYLLLVGCLVLSGCYIPGGKDSENANAVGKYISEKYGRFDNRSTVEKMHGGKIYYVLPGRHPSVDLYEITAPSDIASIEAFANEALKVVGIERIDLVFYEKQNLSCSPNGGCIRLWEHVVHKATIKK